MAMQLRIRRASNDATRLGRGFPVEENSQAQATLKRLVPHHGSIQMQRRFLCPRAEVLETAQVWDVDLPSILPPGPTALRVRPGVEKHAGGVAAQFGDGVQIEADDFSNILLLRLVAVHAMIGEARRQAMPRRTQLLLGEVDPGLILLGLRGVLSRWWLRDRECKSAPARDLSHRERGHLQAPFGTTRTAVEAVPETARLLATLRDAGGVMR
jgi:hypothetical protein